MTRRIKKYDFRKTRDGRRLIMWAGLERGAQVVVGSVTLPGATKSSDLLVTDQFLAARPAPK